LDELDGSKSIEDVKANLFQAVQRRQARI
jgi:hypothetical protein